MLSGIAMLAVKVAVTEAADLYDKRIQNAAIVSKAANNLMLQKSFFVSFWI